MMTVIRFLFLQFAFTFFLRSIVRAQNNDDSNIHAIIVSSSRYWFNYRHANNALGFYHMMKQNGIRDDNIILMLADEYASNARNPYKNRMYANGISGESWYSNSTELDYRGSDVTVQVFLDALTGTAPKALQTDENSKLFIYLTGHGGDNFFKFQDEEELTSHDIALVMDKLYENKKFDEALFIADTCQAFTLFDKLTTPNVLALGSSLREQNAYAHHSDRDLGLASIERWTHLFLKSYYDKAGPHTTLEELMVTPFADKRVLAANVGTKEEDSKRKFKDIRLTDFFGEKYGSQSAKKTKTTTTGEEKAGPAVSSRRDVDVNEVSNESDQARTERLPLELNRIDPQIDGVHERRMTHQTSVPDDVCQDDVPSSIGDTSTFLFAVIGLFSVVIVASVTERVLSK